MGVSIESIVEDLPSMLNHQPIETSIFLKLITRRKFTQVMSIKCSRFSVPYPGSSTISHVDVYSTLLSPSANIIRFSLDCFYKLFVLALSFFFAINLICIIFTSPKLSPQQIFIIQNLLVICKNKQKTSDKIQLFHFTPIEP